MGKKGFNWRARKIVETVIDDSNTSKIEIDKNTYGNNYDKCNTLALPSKKRKTKIKEQKVQVTKILSKSKRKQLEKIVERKNKKENRAALLEELGKVQISPDELNQFTSITAYQTKGLRKRPFNVTDTQKEGSEKIIKINSLSGAKRKRIAALEEDRKITSSDPNVVGFEDDDTETSEDEDMEDNEVNPEDSVEIVEQNIEVPKDAPNPNSDVVIVEKEVNKETPKISVKPIIKTERKPAVFVHVDRTPEIQVARLKLPILAEEQVIVEKINENQIVIIAGETGSGKTTQLPQFLYEAGYAQNKLIGVTEPRRVAAISMSKRVAEEMNLSSDIVSYLIRFEGNTTDQTKIKFMTDGVLLKEVQSDFLLSKYSVIILDEAHERSVYTDILIGLLSRIVPLRQKKNNPLKLIIMSATLRIEDFTNNQRLFKIPPPVLKVDSRQFPVTIHFNKRTEENYLLEAFRKTVKIHKQLPAGGILIFVTGQREVNYLVKKLRRTFPLKTYNKIDMRHQKSNRGNRENQEDSESDEFEEDFHLKGALHKRKSRNKFKLPEISLDDYNLPVDNEDIESGESEIEHSEDEEDEDDVMIDTANCQPLWTLPLYSLLSSRQQAQVFEAPPEGTRLCVVSTNVAETSLTIPNVKYVVDTGRTKVRLYDKITGVSTYQVTWTSKAAADQRAGRAGRTAPGHCYRLYSSAVFNDTFKAFSVPEIQQKPVDDLYLQMKCMNIDKVVNFPFPTAPDLLQLNTAQLRLVQLGALDQVGKTGGRVTPLGKAISRFPVLPRFGKMLALSHQQSLVPFTICMVAALSVPEVLLETPIGEDMDKKVRQKWAQTRRNWAGTGNSQLLGDPMVLLRAVGAAEYANSTGNLEKFCNDNGLRYKALVEIRKLRIQLTNEIKINLEVDDLIVDPQMKPPTASQAKLLRQIVLSGNGDHVARRVNIEEIKDDVEKLQWKNAYQTSELEDPVFLHSGSVLRKEMPEWVVYQELYETNKMYMRGVTAIEPEWLPIYCPRCCTLGEPLKDPEPYYDSEKGKVFCTVSGTFGRQSWPLPNATIPFPDTIAKYQWFARFLLEGKIIPKLESYTNSLLSSPSVMNKSWAHLQPRTEKLLKALSSKEIDSKQKLLHLWNTDPKYLLPEYQSWLPQSAYNEVALSWPPI